MSEWTVHPAATLFPLLEGADFEALVTDIREHGLREPIWLDRDGRILDGRNGLRACEAAGVEPRFQIHEGDDALAFVVSLNLRRRHLIPSQLAMVAARLADMPQGTRTDLASIEAMSQPQAAELLSVSRASVQRAKAVLDGGAEELIRAVDCGTVMVSDAAVIAGEAHPAQRALLSMVTDDKADTLKAAQRKRDLDRQRLDIIEGRVVLPEGKYQVIVIDCPWPYGNNEYRGNHWMGRVATPYPEMSLEKLANLEIPAAPDCIMWCWVTNHFLHEAFHLLEAWGFEYKTLLTWHKKRLGVGNWLRNSTEHVLVATMRRCFM